MLIPLPDHNPTPEGPPQPRTEFSATLPSYPQTAHHHPRQEESIPTHLGLLEGWDVIQLGPELLELCLDLVHG